MFKRRKKNLSFVTVFSRNLTIIISLIQGERNNLHHNIGPKLCVGDDIQADLFAAAVAKGEFSLKENRKKKIKNYMC